MTEPEFLSCLSPPEMLQFLVDRGFVSERKLRLFTVACCRRIWNLMSDDRSRVAVDVAERYADGDATWLELARARRDAWAAIPRVSGMSYPSSYERRVSTRSAQAAAEVVGKTVRKVAAAISSAVLEAAGEAAGLKGASKGEYATSRQTRLREESTYQSDLLRDIFPNPFRPNIFDASWRSETVVSLARGIYEERAWDRMIFLGDALMDAGCDNEEFLGHCRQGNHVRGCWLVDEILNKKLSEKE